MFSLKFIAALSLVALPALADSFDPSRQYPITSSTNWDTGFVSPVLTACGNVLGETYTSLSDIPGYPNVAGTSLIQSITDTGLCGTCWSVTYDSSGTTVNVVLIDSVPDPSLSSPAFTISDDTMESLGALEQNPYVWLQQVDQSVCGL